MSLNIFKALFLNNEDGAATLGYPFQAGHFNFCHILCYRSTILVVDLHASIPRSPPRAELDLHEKKINQF